MATITVIGLKETQKLLRNIPKRFQEEVGEKGTQKIAQSTQRRIKYRYNVLGYGKGTTSTGRGLKSISLKKVGNQYEISVGKYLELIEAGVKSHWVSQEVMEFAISNPNATIGKTARSLGLAPPYIGAPFFWRQKGPFIRHGVEATKKDIPRIIEMQINKAMQRSAS